MSARLGLLNEYECCTYGYSREYEYTHEYGRSKPASRHTASTGARRSHSICGLLVFSALAPKLRIVALLDSLEGRLEL